MATTIVNGYVCTSSCDVAKAKKGIDPHPNTGSADAGGQADAKDEAAGLRRDDTAVTFGGRLARLRTDSVAPAGAAASPEAGSLWTKAGGLNVLV